MSRQEWESEADGHDPSKSVLRSREGSLAVSPGSVTVAYSIVDDKEWGATNPLRYEHNGLKAHTAGTYDAFEKLERYREELERLRDLVCPADVESIDAVLSESQNKH